MNALCLSLFVIAGLALAGCPDNAAKPSTSPAASASAATTTAPAAATGAASAKSGSGW